MGEIFDENVYSLGCYCDSQKMCERPRDHSKRQPFCSLGDSTGTMEGHKGSFSRASDE